MKLFGSYIIVENLPVGDYAVHKDVVIERKNINDFLASIIQGRLFDQLERLKKVKRAYIVIEGDYKEALALRKFSENAFWASVISITEQGAHVVFTQGPEDTARFIYNLGRRVQTGENSLPPPRPTVRKKSLDDYQIAINVLTSLPKIGQKRAEDLLRTFGSLRRFFSANQLELESFFGSEIGKRIYEIINKDFKTKKGKKPPSLLDFEKSKNKNEKNSQ